MAWNISRWENFVFFPAVRLFPKIIFGIIPGFIRFFLLKQQTMVFLVELILLNMMANI